MASPQPTAPQPPEIRPNDHPLTIARGYLDRGWNPIPVSRQTKKPIRKKWQLRRLDDTTVVAAFNRPDLNIGVQQGLSKLQCACECECTWCSSGSSGGSVPSAPTIARIANPKPASIKLLRAR